MKNQLSLLCSICLFSLSNNYNSRGIHIKNNYIDNFDILYKKKINNDDFDISDENSYELEKYIYAILELFDLWETYHLQMSEFDIAFTAFFKNFFGIRLMSNHFHNQTKKQLFIDGLIEKIVYFFQKADNSMKYNLEMQLDYFNSFRFDILQKISYHNQINLISMSFLLDLFFKSSLSENPKSELENKNNATEEQEVTDQHKSSSQIDSSLSKNHDDKKDDYIMQLIAESAEIGLADDGYLYKLFHETIIQPLQKNNLLSNLYFTKEIFLDKIMYGKNHYEPEVYLKQLKKIYHNNYIDAIALDQTYLSWLIKKEIVEKAIINISNQDYLFLLFLTILITQNTDLEALSISQKKILHEKNIIAKSILDYFTLLGDNKKVQWQKLEKIYIEKNKINTLVTMLLL